MKYKFLCIKNLGDEDMTQLIEADGAIEASGKLTIVAEITLNTEFPADKEAALTTAVTNLLSNLGGQDVELISKE